MSGGLIILAIVLPVLGFVLWLAGHFLRARRAEIRSILAKGVEVEAQVVRSRRGRVDYRFEVAGWPHPITGSGLMGRGRAAAAGERITVRYLASHPHISTIVEPRPRGRPIQ
jgi:hypothetical protein